MFGCMHLPEQDHVFQLLTLKKTKKNVESPSWNVWMHATARTRPCFSTSDPKEDYKECGEPPMECIDAVKQIWQSNDGGHFIGRVGPYNITDDSSPACTMMEHELPRNQDSPTCTLIDPDELPQNQDSPTCLLAEPGQTNRCTKDVTGSLQNRMYNLRNIKEKRQSSSFVYTLIKRAGNSTVFVTAWMMEVNSGVMMFVMNGFIQNVLGIHQLRVHQILLCVNLACQRCL